MDTYGCLIRIEEYYGCTGTPNVGLQMNPAAIAAEIRRIENESPYLKGRTITGVADPAIFAETQGESIAAIMARFPNHVYWRKGDHERLPGKMQYHYRMAFSPDGMPLLQVFNTCKHFIRTIPSLVYDQAHVEDIDTEQEDHIYDECRYVLMENPIKPRETTPPPPPRGDDPLDMWADKYLRR